MSDVVIKAEKIGKKYVIGHQSAPHGYVSLRDVIMRQAGSLWSKTRDLLKGNPVVQGDTLEEVWALRDVSFEIKQGEALGIIGRNGAGKSTLLKILSRITEPSSGRVMIKNRVASLLEVGTGFHPELTGRENIFLNGTILGMRRAEIKEKFDEIVAFAEVEQFLDTPVKRYSSGMYVRLAFAVAAHLEPEILVVDEVLAVGDIQFQKKCLGKMGSIGKEGRTVLFVSHNLAAVSNLCSRGIVLDKGAVSFQGAATDAIHHYSAAMINVGKRAMDTPVSQTDSILFLSACMLDEGGEAVSSVGINAPCSIQMAFQVPKQTDGLAVPNFHFKTADGLYAFVVSAPNMKPLGPGVYRATCHVPGNFLNEGMYTVGLAVTEYRSTSMKVHFFEENYLTLSVIDPILDNPLRYGFGGPVPGILRPCLAWTMEKQ